LRIDFGCLFAPDFGRLFPYKQIFQPVRNAGACGHYLVFPGDSIDTQDFELKRSRNREFGALLGVKPRQETLFMTSSVSLRCRL
jgi:hypothetical protein